MKQLCVGVIIPAYNAVNYIGEVIRKTYKFTNHIVVVNDGSSDNTAQVAIDKNISVLSHPQNLGKGEALKTGFRFALKEKWDIIITIDADGQHDPMHIPDFLDAFDRTKADIIIGSRMHRLRDMPRHRILSNKITSGLVSWRIGQRVEDSQSGYRLIHSRVLRKIHLVTSRYETETEILIKSGIYGFKIGSTAIHTLYQGEPSSMHLMMDTWRFIKLYFKSLC